MERKRFSVLFFIKRSKLLKNGEAPVRVRVTYDRLYVELQLKRSIKVPLWSQEKEKSTGKDRNSVELNHYIDALRVKFYQIYQDLELEGKIISARAIVNRYQGKDETFKTLYNVFKEHNDNCRKLIGTDYADITVRRYDNCLKYLMELVKRDYKVDDMLLREVNGELVRKFDLYLKTEKHCAQNTVIRYMKCFKKVINLAIANEWLTKNPFAGIKFHEVEVNKQFLSQAEINRIWQKEFRIERLVLVRDVFIFCVYTGQLALQYAYADGQEKSCSLVIGQVADILKNEVPINGYVAMNLSCIGTVNDAVGGVTVEMDDDYTLYNAKFKKGATVHLQGEEAQEFVQGRDIMVSGSAYSRIGRQKRYLKAFISQAKKTLAQNPALAVNLMSQLSDYMLTDISTDEVLYLSTELSGCNFDEENMQILQGNIQMGEQYEEYYLDDEAVQQTIIDLFYEEQKK